MDCISFNTNSTLHDVDYEITVYILSFDGGDKGYFPVWHIFWVNLFAINCNANEISHPDQLITNGVEVATMPMWVNCPYVIWDADAV